MFNVQVLGPISYETIVYHVISEHRDNEEVIIQFLIWDVIDKKYRFINANETTPTARLSQDLHTQRKIIKAQQEVNAGK